MSLTIRRLLLATSALMGQVFTSGARIELPAVVEKARQPQSNWGRVRWRRTPKTYPYSGQREERRALLRLEFKLENGRWP